MSGEKTPPLCKDPNFTLYENGYYITFAFVVHIGGQTAKDMKDFKIFIFFSCKY